jgi:DNA-binding transcriptional LysR family regulator
LDGFKLRHLKMLVALSEQRKMGVVADMFGLSQPALSRTLAELEAMTGHKLFDRHNRGMTLTPQGEIIVRHAKMVIADTLRAEYEMAAAAAGQGGSVAFGTVMTPASDYVAPVLNKIFQTHPTLDISISIGTSDVLLEDVVSRRLDFAICRIPIGLNPLTFDYVPLGNEMLRLVVAPDHPLAAGSFVRERDLAQQNWVLQQRGSLVRQIVDDFHRRHGIHPGSVVSTSSVLLTLLLVIKTGRVGIFAKPVAELFEQHGLLRSLAIEADLSVPDFGLIKLKERELSAAALLVYEAFLRD